MYPFWFVFIIFLTAAANALGIQQVTVFLNDLIAYIPSIFAAILILLLANFATGSGILASVVQYGIIVYAVFAALTQLGIAVPLTAPTLRGGACGGHSLRDRWSGGGERHHRESVQP